MLHEGPSPSAERAPSGTQAGIIIAVCAGVSVLAIAHHPTVTNVRGPAEAIAAIVRIGSVDRVVHAAMIAIMAALLFGFSVFCARRGFDKQTVVGGFIAYAIGVGAMIAAASIDGFLIPAIAERYLEAMPDGIRFAAQIISICGAAVQVFGKLGAIAMTLAITVWSIGLVWTRGVVRLTGFVGVAAAALGAAVLVFGGPALTPQTLVVIVIGQAVWYFAVAALLVRGRV